jgi:hypothetical protein
VGSCIYVTAGEAPADASLKLGKDTNGNEKPMFFIDDRQIPVGAATNREHGL